jgi:CO/xanthine dehydrogenase FAD-binding subunit
MMLQTFELIRPRNIDAALAVMADGSATPLAGGTDLLVRIKKQLLAPEKVVDLSALEELGGIREDGERIVIGSLITHGEVMESDLANRYLPVLVQGCATVGSPQIRNKGTLGGNIVNASPAADSIPPLIVLGAGVILQSLSGKREMSLEEFIIGPGKTQLRAGELLTGIVVNKMKANERGIYRKLGQRKALAISIASVAVRMEFDPATGICGNPAIAFGAVVPAIRRIKELESLLCQRKLDQQGIRNIAGKARELCSPISDIRASAEYRRAMCSSLLYEALYQLTTDD